MIGCPFCERPVKPVFFDEQRSLVRCTGCQRELGFGPGTNLASPVVRERPRSVEVLYDGRPASPGPAGPRPGALEVRVRFPLYLVFVGALIVVAMVAQTGSVIAGYTDNVARHRAALSFAVLSIGILCSFILFGALILLYGLNRTIIRLDASTLSVRHAPLPWFGDLTLPLADVADIRCNGYQLKGSHLHRVAATTRRGVREVLDERLSAEVALYVEGVLRAELASRRPAERPAAPARA